SASNIGTCNSGSAGDCAAWIRFFQAEFKTHHEIHPGLGMMAECFHNGRALMRGKPVVLEDEADFRLFLLRDLFDLAFFASALLLVMLRIAACRQVASQSHGNGAGGNFSQA